MTTPATPAVDEFDLPELATLEGVSRARMRARDSMIPDALVVIYTTDDRLVILPFGRGRAAVGLRAVWPFTGWDGKILTKDRTRGRIAMGASLDQWAQRVQQALDATGRHTEYAAMADQLERRAAMRYHRQKLLELQQSTDLHTNALRKLEAAEGGAA